MLPARFKYIALSFFKENFTGFHTSVLLGFTLILPPSNKSVLSPDWSFFPDRG